jgi:hypothetical protein
MCMCMHGSVTIFGDGEDDVFSCKYILAHWVRLVDSDPIHCIGTCLRARSTSLGAIQ